MNSVSLIGNLTRDPELRYAGNGTPVCNFAIAISEGKDRNGEDRDPTYVECEAWERTAENIAEYLRKGNKVGVSGSLKLDQWEDRDSGRKMSRLKVRAFQVDFLTPRSDRDEDEDDRRPARRDRDDDNRRPPTRGRDDRDDRRPAARTSNRRPADDDMPF